MTPLNICNWSFICITPSKFVHTFVFELTSSYMLLYLNLCLSLCVRYICTSALYLIKIKEIDWDIAQCTCMSKLQNRTTSNTRVHQRQSEHYKGGSPKIKVQDFMKAKTIRIIKDNPKEKSSINVVQFRSFDSKLMTIS